MASELHLGDLTVDPSAGIVTLASTPLALSSSAVSLLAVLVANRHRVVSRRELATELDLRWERSVDVLVMKIRRVLGKDAVRTVRGRGWIIDGSLFGVETPAST